MGRPCFDWTVRGSRPHDNEQPSASVSLNSSTVSGLMLSKIFFISWKKKHKILIRKLFLGYIVGKLLCIHFWKTAVISEFARYCLHQVTTKRENNRSRFPELMAPSSAQYREYNIDFFRDQWPKLATFSDMFDFLLLTLLPVLTASALSTVRDLSFKHRHKVVLLLCPFNIEIYLRCLTVTDADTCMVTMLTRGFFQGQKQFCVQRFLGAFRVTFRFILLQRDTHYKITPKVKLSQKQ